MDPLLPEKYQEIAFEGDTLLSVYRPGEGMAVPVRTICAVLGLDLKSQSERIRRHEVLRQGLRKDRVPIDGQAREIAVLLHKYIPFWLATISPHQVSEEARPKLVRYQTELVDVLAQIYLRSADAPATPIQQRVDDALADIRRLVESQLNHERRISIVEELVGDIQQRTPVSASQSEYIQRAIKRIAKRFELREGRDIFGKLFAQFCIDLGTPRYDALPEAKYDAALAWLRRTAEMYLPDDPDALPPLQESLL
ncbi:phage antirepressor N-terminal domain-containing protein [Oscillochloris sp. ZM17-4]|uniref:phage antirepressor N-terminal domain-containing protein n=1 Tax=Oscillochloris sp. ZM17-4 TaxID=2866714 RepID=UPI00210412D2|nr:phage antirepressor N-terminal domain-containing protein [Oscillochloris sp. ZM17-4]